MRRFLVTAFLLKLGISNVDNNRVFTSNRHVRASFEVGGKHQLPETIATLLSDSIT